MQNHITELDKDKTFSGPIATEIVPLKHFYPARKTKERRINGRPVFAAVFPGLRAGDYDIWENAPNPSGTVTIVGGEVATVDWR